MNEEQVVPQHIVTVSDLIDFLKFSGCEDFTILHDEEEGVEVKSKKRIPLAIQNTIKERAYLNAIIRFTCVEEIVPVPKYLEEWYEKSMKYANYKEE